MKQKQAAVSVGHMNLKGKRITLFAPYLTFLEKRDVSPVYR